MRPSTLGSAFLLLATVGLSALGCANTSRNSAEDGGSSCKLGGSCSQADVCSGGIAGCTSNCQCLSGTWQAPCPVDLPQTGSSCTPAGAECGYSNQPNPCGASNCYCQGGAWSCGPTCVFDASAAEADVSVAAFCVDAAPTQTCTAAAIHASNYDQTCQASSDCLLVVEGYACASCAVCAPSSAINRSAVSQYEADVAKIVGPTMGGGGGCAPCCGPSPVACCRGGQCHADSQCLPLDGSADAADAGAE